MALGEILLVKKELQQTGTVLSKAVSIMQGSQESNQHDLVEALWALASVPMLQKDWSTGESLLVQCIPILQRTRNRNNSTYVLVLVNLTVAYYRQNKLDKAECAGIEGIQVIQLFKDSAEELPIFYYFLARTYREQGRLLEAEVVNAAAIAQLKLQRAGDRSLLPKTLQIMWQISIALEKYSDAEKHLLEAVELLQKSPRSSQAILGDAYKSLALIYIRQERLSEFVVVLPLAIEIWIQFLGEQNKNIAELYCILARAYTLLSRLREAEDMYVRAIDIARALQGQSLLLAEIELGLRKVMDYREDFSDQSTA